jgi:hypothetical protein
VNHSKFQVPPSCGDSRNHRIPRQGAALLLKLKQGCPHCREAFFKKLKTFQLPAKVRRFEMIDSDRFGGCRTFLPTTISFCAASGVKNRENELILEAAMMAGIMCQTSAP